jgi:uncharacterized alkaline shock family protein YloU
MGNNIITNENGNIVILNNVIAAIVGVTIAEIKEVAVSGTLKENVAKLFNWKNVERGVQVDSTEEGTTIDIFLNIKYGLNAPETAKKVQNAVKNAVRIMTDINVTQINVNVVGLFFAEENLDSE